MNNFSLRQRILSRAAKILFAVYNVVIITVAGLVLIRHRVWSLKPRGKNAGR